VDGSVAAAIGLKREDVLLSAGDKPLSGLCDLPLVLASVKKGSVLPLHIWRGGAESVLQAQF
jgi:S1-C subfamily serine protease